MSKKNRKAPKWIRKMLKKDYVPSEQTFKPTLSYSTWGGYKAWNDEVIWPHGKAEIVPNLWVGAEEEAQKLWNNPEWWMIDVRESLEAPRANATRIQVLSKTKPFNATIETLEAISREIDKRLAQGYKVLVHCWAGQERSPLSITWWLRTRHGYTLDEAYALLKDKRPLVLDRRSWLSTKAA